MWKKSIVELLIENYQLHEHLYNINHPAYNDKTKRARSFMFICRELRRFDKDITIQGIKKKIHTLRAQFIKESREIAERKKNPVDPNYVYVPKLWCFPQLEFLKSHCRVRTSLAKVSEAFESDNSLPTHNDIIVENTEEKSPSHCYQRDYESDNSFVTENDISVRKDEEQAESPSYKRDSQELETFDVFEEVEVDNNFIEENPAKRPRKVTKELKTVPEIGNSNEFTTFGESISYQLQKLPEEDAYSLMAEMQNLITKRKLKNLRIARSYSTYSNEST